MVHGGASGRTKPCCYSWTPVDNSGEKIRDTVEELGNACWFLIYQADCRMRSSLQSADSEADFDPDRSVNRRAIMFLTATKSVLGMELHDQASHKPRLRQYGKQSKVMAIDRQSIT
eukprot:2517644-Amphidinium_carterae.1